MNAQTNPLLLAIAAVVASCTAKSAAGSKANEASKSTAAALRDFATVSAQMNVPVQRAQDAMRAAMTTANVKKGTVKPYAVAFANYRQAISEGVNLATGGTDGKPLTVPQAAIYGIKPEKRDAAKAEADVRAEITKRLRAVKNLADLTSFRDLLPAVEGAVTTTVPAAESPADILADYLSDESDEGAEGEGEAQEAQAA